MADVRCYLKLEPRWRGDRLAGVDIAGVTKNRPHRSAGPVVALTLRVPDAAFLPLRPEVVIDVPERALDFTPTVTVEFPVDPNEGQADG